MSILTIGDNYLWTINNKIYTICNINEEFITLYNSDETIEIGEFSLNLMGFIKLNYIY